MYGDDDFYQRFQDRLTDFARSVPIWVRAIVAAAFALLTHGYLVRHHYRGNPWALSYVAALFGLGFIEAFQMLVNYFVIALMIAAFIWLMTKIMT